jgi:chemotaxis signal transduction protein
VSLADSLGNERQLGIVAEKVTETFQCEREQFVPAGVSSRGAPYLGPVAAIAGRLVQLVDARSLLPDAVSEALFEVLEVSA